MPPSHPTPASEWREHWPIVLAGVIGMAVCSLPAYSMGVMMAPLEAEFGWSRAEITSGMLISSTISVIFSPFMGMLIDRLGVRPIGLSGIIIYCFALGLLSQTSRNIWTWWFLWTILAFALLQIKPTVWVSAVTQRFSRARGLALAVVLSGTGVGTVTTPLLSQFLLSHFGWRTTYVLLALVWGTLAIPIAYFFLDRRRAASESRDVRHARHADPEIDRPGMTIRDGLLSSVFARLAISVFTMSVANVALIINLIPILVSRGTSATMAATLAGISGLATVAGRLLGGYLLDRMNARLVAGFSVFLPAIGSVLLISLPGNLAATLAAVLLLGLSSGAEIDAVSYMAGRYFGMRNFGTLFGTLSGVTIFGVGVGPVLANHVYDVTGSYEIVLWGIIPLVSLSAYLFFTSAPYPDFLESKASFKQL